MHDADNSVIIIGAGAAGLSTAAALGHRGVPSSILDRDDAIGNTWARRYQCLKLHTIRRFSGLAHYPIPTDNPKYLSKDEYADYLEGYAQEMQLDVLLNENVEAVTEDTQGPGGINWKVTSESGTRRARVIVIATGHYAEPYLPSWEGFEEYTGVVLHSSQYTTGVDYIGRKALVVGMGNSGAEIAADLSVCGAAGVSLSVRTSPPIVTREMFGIVPVQLFGIALTPLGLPRVIDRVGALLRRISIGDLTAYGLAPAAWGPFTSRQPAVIDNGFVKQLKQHRIVVRSQISKFDSKEVVYKDGTREAIDVVVAATGFRTGLGKFLKVPGVLDDSGQPRFRSGGPTSTPGLYFIGFDETVRGHLFEIERDSRRLAAEIDSYLRRPT
jgi:putative flavoprotein involved in K+ transport